MTDEPTFTTAAEVEPADGGDYVIITEGSTVFHETDDEGDAPACHNTVTNAGKYRRDTEYAQQRRLCNDCEEVLADE